MLIGVTIAEMVFFFDFSNWRLSTILELLCACLDYTHPQIAFGGIYQCADLSIGWNRCIGLDKMQVLTFNEFHLKMPIHAQNGGFVGFDP